MSWEPWKQIEIVKPQLTSEYDGPCLSSEEVLKCEEVLKLADLEEESNG